MLSFIKKFAETWKQNKWEIEHKEWLNFQKILKDSTGKHDAPLALFIDFESHDCFEKVPPYVMYHFRKMEGKPNLTKIINIHNYHDYMRYVGCSKRIQLVDEGRNKTYCFLSNIGVYRVELTECCISYDDITLFNCSLRGECAEVGEVTKELNVQHLFVRADMTAEEVLYKGKYFPIQLDHYTMIF